MLAWSLDYTLKFGISMVIVLGFEYTTLWANALTGLLKYILHSIDLRREEPWESKSMYIFYIDLVKEFFILVCYVVFFAVIVHRYGLPLHLIRDLYVTFRSFIQHCRDLIHYKKATRNMNERYPNATVEDLNENDNICIICREEMTVQADNNSSDVPKKLRCGHIFHLRCLKSWLERQQSCPTCRCSLLDNNDNNNNRNANAQPQAAAGQAQAQQQNNEAQQQNAQQPQASTNVNQNNNTTGTASTQRSVPEASTSSAISTGITQPFLRSTNINSFTLPFSLPQTSNITLMNTNNNEEKSAIPIILTPIASLGPNADSNIPPIESLSDEKLREIEGSLRQNVISRIKAISEINQQLNGIVTQLNQVLSYMPEFPKASDTTSSDSTSKEDNKTDINNESSDPVKENVENINNDPKGKSVETTDNTPAPEPTSESAPVPTTVENEIKPETIEN